MIALALGTPISGDSCIADWCNSFGGSNKWYQSIPGSAWDRVLIPRASVVDWQRSCVDLGAALGLFMGSCVDLKIAFGFLKESNLVE